MQGAVGSHVLPGITLFCLGACLARVFAYYPLGIVCEALDVTNLGIERQGDEVPFVLSYLQIYAYVVGTHVCLIDKGGM